MPGLPPGVITHAASSATSPTPVTTPTAVTTVTAPTAATTPTAVTAATAATIHVTEAASKKSGWLRRALIQDYLCN